MQRERALSVSNLLRYDLNCIVSTLIVKTEVLNRMCLLLIVYLMTTD